VRGRRRLGLRARATIGFGLTGFVGALVLAVITGTLARSYLIDQREATARQQAYVNARLLRAGLRAADPDLPTLLSSLQGGSAAESFVRKDGEWYASSVGIAPTTIPDGLVDVVSDGSAGHQRYRDADGDLRLAVGVPVAAVDAGYFEVLSLEELDDAFGLLTRALAIGVVGAAVAAALVGRAAAGRLLRPLGPVADAAELIADGELGTRLTGIDDPDLRRLTDAFNAMAASLEARIEREARFAADVSHELRSPLTAVAAAVEVIERRRDELPPHVLEALAVLVAKVDTFQRIVLDLLEISRIDAGTASMVVDVIDLEHFLPRVVARHGADDAVVTFLDGAPRRIEGDRRRLAQAMGNIVENAATYAGGITEVTVSADRDSVRFVFDDNGPGVSVDERRAIFGRFARGHEGVRVGSKSGSGLGLSLVAEHVGLHGGRTWVESSPSGGARFVIELPVKQS
jgi:signal transduction histidine kinase